EMEKISETEYFDIIDKMKEIPSKVQEVLDNRDYINVIADEIVGSEHAFFLGRGVDYALAMETALNSALESAITTFYYNVSETESYIPQSHYFLVELKDSIPGLSYLVTNWSESIRLILIESLSSFSSSLRDLDLSFVSLDPITLVEKGNRSGSEAFEKHYKYTVFQLIFSYLEPLDTELWTRLEIQYSNWITTSNFLFNKQYSEFEKIDIKSALADMITNDFFQCLGDKEELFRTTPDPFGDKVVMEIFNLN
ncbi:MAG: hypothetical protein HUK24_00480, partial [Sphaerochaetaceae bacterium]|nr:hypothetical protein [Sphaerochaetaceae bacterium]